MTTVLITLGKTLLGASIGALTKILLAAATETCMIKIFLHLADKLVEKTSNNLDNELLEAIKKSLAKGD